MILIVLKMILFLILLLYLDKIVTLEDLSPYSLRFGVSAIRG
jgi:hypothetical protein